jgi:hypothetical protein
VGGATDVLTLSSSSLLHFTVSSTVIVTAYTFSGGYDVYLVFAIWCAGCTSES